MQGWINTAHENIQLFMLMLKTNLLIGKLGECNNCIKADDYNRWVEWFKVHGDNIWHM